MAFKQVTQRNIAYGALKRTTSTPHSTREITVKFAEPVVVGLDSFAATLAAALGAAPPKPVLELNGAKIRVRLPDGTPLGDVILRLVDGRVIEMTVTRA